MLPDFPGKASGTAKWLLTEEERRVAVLRMQRDRTSETEERRSVWYGLKLAVTDYRTWILVCCSFQVQGQMTCLTPSFQVVMLIANHTAYGFSYFYPTIVSGLNLGSRTITLVLTAPPYLLAACSALAVAYSSDRNNERGWHVSVPMSFAVIGFIISVATLNVGARYFASFVFICGCYSSNAGVFSWASSTLNQTPEKKAAAVALINLMSQLGNIWSPYCKH